MVIAREYNRKERKTKDDSKTFEQNDEIPTY